MAAYWIARSHVNNPEEYAKYAQRAPAILARYGGRILARGGKFKILEGTDQFERFVVVEFPDMAQAEACHASEDYQAAAQHRSNGAGVVDLIIVESMEKT